MVSSLSDSSAPHLLSMKFKGAVSTNQEQSKSMMAFAAGSAKASAEVTAKSREEGHSTRSKLIIAEQ